MKGLGIGSVIIKTIIRTMESIKWSDWTIVKIIGILSRIECILHCVMLPHKELWSDPLFL